MASLEDGALKSKRSTTSEKPAPSRATSMGKEFAYERIAQALQAEIASQVYASGRLPTELVLSVRHHVSVGTMRKALDMLVTRNIIVRKRGSGTYVHPDFSNGQEHDNSRRTHLIGYISTTQAESSIGHFFNRLMINVHQAVERSGYALAVSHIHNGQLALPIKRQRLDGLVVAGTYWGPLGRKALQAGATENSHLIEQIKATGLPVVTISNSSDAPYLHRVNVDYDKALGTAIQELMDQGHQHIALFGGPRFWPAFGQRIDAFIRQSQFRGLTCDNRNLCIYDRWVDQDFHKAATQVEQFVRSRPEITAGIVVSAAPTAVLNGIAQAGRSWPDNFSLVSFSDIQRSDIGPQEMANIMREMPLGMSSLEMPVSSMACVAVNRLVALLEGRRFAPDETEILLDMTWNPGNAIIARSAS
jgi:DNA-binding LacI/PurR family transcriptional regulator